jgi:hypothetical protein
MTDTTVDTSQTVPPAIEAEARDYGWTPKEDFRGPADKWQPANEYLEWAKRNGRMPKSEFDEFKRQFPAIRRENAELKTELGQVKETLKEFVEFSSKAEQRAYERARREIEQKAETAAASGDQAGVRQAMADLDNLQKPQDRPKPTETTQQKPPIDPTIQDWIERNSWYIKDRALNGYATDVYGELERSAPGMSVEERLAETKKRTIDKFPEKFGINPARENATRSVAEPSGNAAPRRNARTYENLPPDAKAACDKFVKTIPGYKREDYVRDFDWES